MKLSNWLIIAGAGRNTGKTTLACSLLELYSHNSPAAVKISPHFHDLDPDENILVRTQEFIIVKENRINQKDSSRMLQAGAAESYYVQVKDDSIDSMLAELLKLTGRGRPVICESGYLRTVIEPGLYFFMDYSDNAGEGDRKEPVPTPDRILSLKEIDSILPAVKYTGKSWELS